jgi:predicted ATPase
MKIKKLTLRNFKGFVDQKTFSFTNESGEINDVTLILGNNGTGKSTILQAIAAIVGGAANPKQTPDSLNWPGYNYSYIQSGTLPLVAKATLSFSTEERAATIEFAQDVRARNQAENFILPTNEPEVEYSLDFQAHRVLAARGARQFFQIMGHQYARQLTAKTTAYTKLFDRVGTIYWYTEQRSSNSITLPNGGDSPTKNVGDNELRNSLSIWARFDKAIEGGMELREGQKNIYQAMLKNYQTVFPGRSFVGPIPKMNLDGLFEDEDFFLSDGRNQYELSGMSGGERAIFPVLVDFANWNINNSIILIDEIELHLHPPLQQAFLRALPKLGKNNQFIITTHSEAVASMVPDDQKIRLK